MPKVTQLSLHF